MRFGDLRAANQRGKESIDFLRIPDCGLAMKPGKHGVHAIKFGIIQRSI
jgi:hypothetical protein